MVSFHVAICFAVAAIAALPTVTAEPPQADQFDRMLDELSASGSGYVNDVGVLPDTRSSLGGAGVLPDIRSSTGDAGYETVQITTRPILPGGSVVSTTWGQCGGDQNGMCPVHTFCKAISRKMSLCYPA